MGCSICKPAKINNPTASNKNPLKKVQKNKQKPKAFTSATSTNHTIAANLAWNKDSSNSGFKKLTKTDPLLYILKKNKISMDFAKACQRPRFSDLILNSPGSDLEHSGVKIRRVTYRDKKNMGIFGEKISEKKLKELREQRKVEKEHQFLAEFLEAKKNGFLDPREKRLRENQKKNNVKESPLLKDYEILVERQKKLNYFLRLTSSKTFLKVMPWSYKEMSKKLGSSLVNEKRVILTEEERKPRTFRRYMKHRRRFGDYRSIVKSHFGRTAEISKTNRKVTSVNKINKLSGHGWSAAKIKKSKGKSEGRIPSLKFTSPINSKIENERSDEEQKMMSFREYDRRVRKGVKGESGEDTVTSEFTSGVEEILNNNDTILETEEEEDEKLKLASHALQKQKKENKFPKKVIGSRFKFEKEDQTKLSNEKADGNNRSVLRRDSAELSAEDSSPRSSSLEDLESVNQRNPRLVASQTFEIDDDDLFGENEHAEKERKKKAEKEELTRLRTQFETEYKLEKSLLEGEFALNIDFDGDDSSSN
jgi:hypothetical protein